MSDGIRRRVTYTQLETLWEFLNNHRGIATGYNKTARARDTSKRLWTSVAETLNAQGDGAVKDWKGWSKYWNDYKSKLKKTVANIRASQQRTGGGPSDAQDLSDIEKRFLQILGDSFGSGLPGARVEPFDQLPVEVPQIEEVNDMVSQSLVGSTILLENIEFENSPQPGPSGLPSTPRRHSEPLARTPAQSPGPRTPAPAAHTVAPRGSPQPRTPRRSPRRTNAQRRVPVTPSTPQRRRRRRQEPLMSQEVAQRNLVAISNERSQHDQTRNEVLRQLIQEIREIKELLQTREYVDKEMILTANLENVRTVDESFMESLHRADMEDKAMVDQENEVSVTTKQVCPAAIQYTVSNQGSLQMILNRFVYYLKHTNRNNSRQWRCVDYVSPVKCPAHVVTKDDVVLHRIAAHTHPFHDKKILKKVHAGAIFSAIQDAEKQGNVSKKIKSEKFNEDSK